MDWLTGINNLKTSRVYVISWRQLMSHTSVGRSINGTDLVGCVTFLDAVISQGCLVRVPGRPSIRVTLTILKPHGADTRLLPSSERRGFSPGAWGFSFFGKCHRGLRHFWSRWARLGFGSAPGSTLKNIVPHWSGWWDGRQIPFM